MSTGGADRRRRSKVYFTFKERKLDKLLKAAEKTIAKLKAKVKELTQELDKYTSIREQLSAGNLQQENKALQESNNFCKSIIEKHGLTHLLGRGRKLQEKNRDAR